MERIGKVERSLLILSGTIDFVRQGLAGHMGQTLVLKTGVGWYSEVARDYATFLDILKGSALPQPLLIIVWEALPEGKRSLLEIRGIEGYGKAPMMVLHETPHGLSPGDEVELLIDSIAVEEGMTMDGVIAHLHEMALRKPS